MVNGVFEKDQLKLFIERIERLEEEKKGIGDDIRDVFAEAKAAGFHPATMRKCIKLRTMPQGKRDEDEALLESYKAALGLSFDDTPLGATLTGDGTGEALPPASDEEREAPAKPKRGRPKKVRDPSDGSEKLVTVPTGAAPTTELHAVN